MKVAIYTLCRDRLAYSKRCFRSLWQNAGYPVDHYVIDNGSTDGTVEWLYSNAKRFKKIVLEPDNTGISYASNMALDIIGNGYDLIVKMDNDCEGLNYSCCYLRLSARFGTVGSSPSSLSIERSSGINCRRICGA